MLKQAVVPFTGKRGKTRTIQTRPDYGFAHVFVESARKI